MLDCIKIDFGCSLQNQTITLATSSMPSSGVGQSNGITHKPNTDAIVGGVIGGLVGLALAILAVVLCRRHSYCAPIIKGNPESVGLSRPEPFLYNISRSGMNTSTEGCVPTQLSITTMAREKNCLHAQNSISTTTIPTVSTSISNASPCLTSSRELSLNTQQPVMAPTEVHELRTAVENLTRAMQQIGVDNNEPPPTYAG